MERDILFWAHTSGLIFVVVSVFCFLIKIFNRPSASANGVNKMLPAWGSISLLFLAQVFQVPYLFAIGSPFASFYANTAMLLSFCAITFELYNTCFLGKRYSLKWQLFNYVPVFVLLSIMAFFVLFRDVDYSKVRLWIFVPTICVSVYYILRNINLVIKIRKIVAAINKNKYSDDADFPLQLAKRGIVWLASLACVLLLLVYVLDSLALRAVVDIILALGFVAVIVFSPDRIFVEDDHPALKKTHMSGERLGELSSRLLDLMDNKELFRNHKLSMEMLTGADAMNTNRVYVSQVISELGYKSFYDMVNQYRVEYAIKCITENSDIQMKNVFYKSGFSSHSAMNKAFNTYKGRTPASYKN